MTNKVYCGNCKHFQLGQLVGNCACLHPNNMKQDMCIEPRLKPEKSFLAINKNLDCEWFEQKQTIWKRMLQAING